MRPNELSKEKVLCCNTALTIVKLENTKGKHVPTVATSEASYHLYQINEQLASGAGFISFHI